MQLTQLRLHGRLYYGWFAVLRAKSPFVSNERPGVFCHQSQPQSGASETPCRPRALVLAPTRELVQQIAAEATRLAHGSAIQVAVVYGGSPKAEQVCHRPASRARPGDPRLWRGARGTMFSSCWRYASPA